MRWRKSGLAGPVDQIIFQVASFTFADATASSGSTGLKDTVLRARDERVPFRKAPMLRKAAIRTIGRQPV
ncbi:hypothetical protein AA0482_1095 [Acetobacter cibinongensis NRIC 0482]|nr:hypothetical protein AA0482_1095 [Acetobacter cibinongensis NRIC 0482]